MMTFNSRGLKNLHLRSDVIRSVRRFFFDRDFIEVETPVRHPAPIPEAHIDPVESDGWCLHASPEIFMKPLLAFGCERIFQIARVFRKGERGAKHLSELTLLEWYETGADYSNLMDDLEALFRYIAAATGRDRVITYQGSRIDLSAPWDRLSVRDAFDRYGSVTVDEALVNDRFDDVMGLEIEPNLGYGKPVFLYDYPAEKGSLARLKHGDPTVAERFELYIAGLELCNGFTELTDPVEQKKRFLEEVEIRKRNGKRCYPVPESFLAMLSDIPAAAGVAVGVDRMVMVFADAAVIDEVVAFAPSDR